MRHRIAVVDLVVRHLARHRQGLGRDAGRHAGRIADRVVAGQASPVQQGRAADRHGLGVARVLVAEHRRLAGEGQGFAVDQAGQAATEQLRHGIAIVDLVTRYLARHRQGFGRDAGRQASWIADRVVAGQTSAVQQGRAADRHGFGVRHVLVAEDGCLPGDGQAFIAHQAGQAATDQLRHRIAVVDLVTSYLARHRQGLGRDAGRQAGRIADRVVAGRTSPVQQGRAADRHGFGVARVLVAERRRLTGEGEGFVAHQASQGAAAQLRHRIAVVDLVDRHLARHRQGLGRDAGRQAGRIADRVVAGRTSAVQQGRAADRHGLGVARVLVAEHRRLAGEGQGFAVHQAAQAATEQLRHRIAIVDLVARHLARDRQGFRRDIGRAAGVRATQEVVAGVRTRQCNAADRHTLGGARILVAEQARACNTQAVVANNAIKACRPLQSGRSQAVIGLVVHAHVRHTADRCLGDIGHAAGRRAGQNVVARVRATQGDVAHVHCFTGARVLVAEFAISRHRQAVVAEDAAKGRCAVHGGRFLAIIGLVIDAHVRHAADAGLGDIGHAAGRRAGQRIVASIRPAQCQTADIDGLARARILVAEDAAAGHSQAVVAEDAAEGRRAVERGRDGGIVGLVVDAHVRHAADAGLGDIGHAAGRRAGQRIVASIRPAQCQTADIDGLARARILVAEDAAAGHGQAVGAEDAIEGRRAVERGRDGGIVGLVVDAHVRHAADAGLGDVGHAAGRRAGQNVVARIRATQGDVADVHCFTGARVLVAKFAISRHGQAVGAEDAAEGRRAVQGGRFLAIIGLVVDAHARHAANGCLGNIRCHPAGVAEGVVAGQAGGAIRDRRTRHGDDLAAACVLVGENAGLVRQIQVQRLTADQAAQCAARQHGIPRAVIVAVRRRHARHRQGFRRDSGCHAAGIAEGVVAGQAGGAIRDRRARHGDDLATARVLVGENAGLVRQVQVQRLAADQTAQCAARQHGVPRAVIVAVRRRHARHRQGLGRNHQVAIDIADSITGLAARRVQAAGRHAIAAYIHGA